MRKCVFCDEMATVGVRGIVLTNYIHTCPFHAGMLQMILETLHVSDSIKWRPYYEADE